MNLPKFKQSIYPNKCLFYEDVKQLAKVYFVNAIAVRIRQSFSSPKFPVLRYCLVDLLHFNENIECRSIHTQETEFTAEKIRNLICQIFMKPSNK